MQFSRPITVALLAVISFVAAVPADLATAELERSIICVRVPDAVKIPKMSAKRDDMLLKLGKRACTDYACEDYEDCEAVGCEQCLWHHTPCGDVYKRCA